MYKFDDKTGELHLDQPPMAALDCYLQLLQFTSYIKEPCAKDTVNQAAKYLKLHNPLCNLTYVSTGEPVFNKIIECDDNNIVSLWLVVLYVNLGPNIIHYNVPFRDGTAICIVEMHYKYNNPLHLLCNPCLINTFLNLHNRLHVILTCLTCLNDTVAPVAGWCIACNLLTKISRSC